MNLSTAADVSAELRQGRLPAVAQWLLDEAAQLIADSFLQRTGSPALDETRKVVEILNANCQFELTRTVAEAWLAMRGFDPSIQKRLAQALINTKLLDKAEQLSATGLDTCEQLASSDHTAYAEISEYRGLLARIAKQRFVNSGERDLNALVDATNRYLAEYERAPEINYWHGINAVACLQLEQEYGPPRDRMPAPQALANDILATVRDSYSDKRRSWLASTASEANLALKRCDEAELWLYRFLTAEDTTPFNIDSYARQLSELWRGNPLLATNCAGRLAQIIARFIATTQSRVTISPTQVPAIKSALELAPDVFEKNFLGESSFTPDSIRGLLKAFESIGCVMNDIGARLGTGFLVRGASLKSAFGDAPVFVTNAHVISQSVIGVIRPDKARVTFELDGLVDGRRPEYQVKEVLFSSAPGNIGVRNSDGEALDCTIVRLEGLQPAAPALRVTSDLPLVSPLTKAFVAGHPRGAGLQIALHDSLLLDIDDEERLVHYRTPTDPGSSGSPVFNADWEVMALHHAGTTATPRLHGDGTYEANEGISIAAIRRKLNA